MLFHWAVFSILCSFEVFLWPKCNFSKQPWGKILYLIFRQVCLKQKIKSIRWCWKYFHFGLNYHIYPQMSCSNKSYLFSFKGITCQEHHWSSLLIFFSCSSVCQKLSLFLTSKKFESKSPNKTLARLKNIISFRQHSSVWLFRFPSPPKHKEVMFIHCSSITGWVTHVKPACLIRVMLIRRKQLEQKPRCRNTQRKCVKPVGLQTKSVCWCAFTHTNITEAYCPSWNKTVEWAEDCGCVKHDISDCTCLILNVT